MGMRDQRFVPGSPDDAHHQRQQQPEVPPEPRRSGSPAANLSLDRPSLHDRKPTRLDSLDAFRGLTIVLMLLVNNIALDKATPEQFLHAKWNAGVHLADLVFPWFLLCVGIALPFSIRSFKAKEGSYWLFAWKASKRLVLLFAVGLLVDSAIAKTPIFALGVLQLIALSYWLAALLSWLRTRYRLLTAFALLVGYGLMIQLVPVPGQTEVVFLEQDNLLRYINREYLMAYGLAGLMSVIPCAALVLLSTVVGQVLAARTLPPVRKLLWLLAMGAVMTAAGLVWGMVLPFNKPVWTSSYILLAAGLGTILQANLFAIFDWGNRGKWAYPLTVLGANALLAYAGAILVKVLILQVWTVGPAKETLQHAWERSLFEQFGRIEGGWLYTVSYIAGIWVVLAILYHRKVFVRL